MADAVISPRDRQQEGAADEDDVGGNEGHGGEEKAGHG
jgi:hypothetical protein